MQDVAKQAAFVAGTLQPLWAALSAVTRGALEPQVARVAAAAAFHAAAAAAANAATCGGAAADAEPAPAPAAADARR